MTAPLPAVDRNRLRRGLLALLWLLAISLPAAAVFADSATPLATTQKRGAEVWRTTCATCHENPTGRTPNRYFLTQTRSPDYILRALTTGVMRDIAAHLSLDDKKAVATYLIGRPPSGEFNPNANRCKTAGPPLTLGGSAWNGWGGQGVDNWRYQRSPGFTAGEVPRLKVKWAFALPGGVANEPTVVGGRLFVSSMAGYLFSLDARTGCTYWSKDFGVPARAAVTIGRLPSGRLAAFAADWYGTVYALDPLTGAEIWKVRPDEHPAVRLTASPVLHDGRLYVSASSGEEGLAGDPKYVCCTFRGSVMALDAATGRTVWKSYTIDQPPGPLPGGHRRGPAGAAVWAAPTIDAKRRLIYAVTGDDYSEPTSDASDAVIAYDLDTGKKRWTKQLLAGDLFILGCSTTRTRNCPTVELGPDHDLGASPLLVRTAAGKEILVAMTKGALAYGLDPDRPAKPLWEIRLGRGGYIGGIQWGAATDGRTLFIPVSDAPFGGAPPPGPNSPPAKPGLNAVTTDGKLLWHVPAPKVACTFGEPCNPAHSAAAAAIPGVVFAGSFDGHERAFAMADGRILWDFDTGRTFPAVNGGQASGGSIDHGAQTIAGGMLFVTSGGRQGRPGNLLLAFTVDGK